jgi:hypothetical protein
MWGCVENCVGVLVISVLVLTVFCIVSFMCIYSYLLLLQGLLPPSENSMAVNNINNDNNFINCYH